MKQKSTMENSLNLSGHDTLLQKKNVNKNLLSKEKCKQKSNKT